MLLIILEFDTCSLSTVQTTHFPRLIHFVFLLFLLTSLTRNSYRLALTLYPVLRNSISITCCSPWILLVPRTRWLGFPLTGNYVCERTPAYLLTTSLFLILRIIGNRFLNYLFSYYIFKKSITYKISISSANQCDLWGNHNIINYTF